MSAGRRTCSITLNSSGSGCNVRFVSSGTGWGYTTYRLEERHGVVFRHLLQREREREISYRGIDTYSELFLILILIYILFLENPQAPEIQLTPESPPNLADLSDLARSLFGLLPRVDVVPVAF